LRSCCLCGSPFCAVLLVVISSGLAHEHSKGFTTAFLVTLCAPDPQTPWIGVSCFLLLPSVCAAFFSRPSFFASSFLFDGTWQHTQSNNVCYLLFAPSVVPRKAEDLVGRFKLILLGSHPPSRHFFPPFSPPEFFFPIAASILPSHRTAPTLTSGQR